MLTTIDHDIINIDVLHSYQFPFLFFFLGETNQIDTHIDFHHEQLDNSEDNFDRLTISSAVGFSGNHNLAINFLSVVLTGILSSDHDNEWPINWMSEHSSSKMSEIKMIEKSFLYIIECDTSTVGDSTIVLYLCTRYDSLYMSA